MDSLAPQCFAGDEKDVMEFRLRMTAFRPLKHAKEAFEGKVSYYVAVIENDTFKILSRSNHDLKVKFNKGQATKVMFEHLTQKFPKGKSVSLYVGFNLNTEQLNSLRKERENKLKSH